MRPLLSLLLVYVLLSVEAMALSGGPVFSSGSTAGTGVGTFAGVLTPKDSDTSGLTASTSNSLGLFSISSPATGLATGSFAYFDSGATYVGTITGIVDPDNLRLRAIVKGQFNFEESLITSDGSSETLLFPNGYANGSLEARVKQGSSLVIRLEGEADLDVQSADNTGLPTGAVRSLELDIDGFRQSATPGAATDLSTLLNTSSTSTSTTSG